MNDKCGSVWDSEEKVVFEIGLPVIFLDKQIFDSENTTTFHLMEMKEISLFSLFLENQVIK